MNLQHLTYTFLNILNEMSPYILLGFLIAGLLHVFVRPELMSRHLAGRGLKPVFKAAMLGTPLPLCSCGVLPTAVSLRRQGASKGATASFLIATPQTGVDSIAATYALLGLPFALLRPVAALAGAMAGGAAVDRLAENDTPVKADPTSCHEADEAAPAGTDQPSLLRRLGEAVRYGFFDMVGSVGKWLVIGLIIAALITVLVPDTFFLSLQRYPLLAMLAMVAVAVPMYICATGSIPIALSLMLKGLSPGVAFVMLMAGPAANFASVMVLRKSMGTRATAIYVGSVVVTAIAFGLIIDYLLPASWFSIAGASAPVASCHMHFNWFSLACSALLVALLLRSAITSRMESIRLRRQFRQLAFAGATDGTTATSSCCRSCESDNYTSNNNKNMKTTLYIVKGMACNHCKASVEKALAALAGVESVKVDLASGQVAVEGTADAAQVEKAVTDAGFEFGGLA